MSTKINIKWEQKIKNEDPIVRENFAEFLGQRKNIKEAPKLLTRLLRDSNYNVRCAAINSLKKIGGKKYFLKVLPLLNDKDELVRVAAVECVAYLGGEKASRYLIKHLDDRSELVRKHVGGWIGEIGDKTLTKYLVDRLKHERSGLAKVGLLEGLYLLGQEERLLEIIRLFRSRRYQVRCCVANILASLVNKQNKRLIRESLVNALNIETTIAVRSSIKNALRCVGE